MSDAYFNLYRELTASVEQPRVNRGERRAGLLERDLRESDGCRQYDRILDKASSAAARNRISLHEIATRA